MRFIIVLSVFLCAINLMSQKIYPPDSLTTIAALPKTALPKEYQQLPPRARLQQFIYAHIRYPSYAMQSRTSGEILVHGVVDTLGNFTPDSLTYVTVSRKVSQPAISLGTTSDFESKKDKLVLSKRPHKWKRAYVDLANEALRIAGKLPPLRPGTVRGEKVASYFELSVKFRVAARW